MATEALPSDSILREVARDVNSLHEPDLLLTGLVRRVRATIGCDLAYLSLNDMTTRHTQIRFSDGIRTTAYRSIRMPVGTGVLGMAAAGVTTESADYLRDVAKLHIESVDAAVLAEEVRAIRSTPLRAGGEVVGALTIANRSAGAFTPQQRTALDEAALIGAVAVNVYNMRVQLQESQERFERRIAEGSTAAAADHSRAALSEELSAALAAGNGTAEMLAVASIAVGAQIRLGIDPDGESSRLVDSRPFALESGGVLEIHGLNDEQADVLGPIVARFVSISLTYERAIEDARHLRESELVERLVDPSPELAAHPLKSGLPGSGALEVIVVEIRDPNSRRAAAASVRGALGKQAITAERKGTLVVISRSPGASSRVESALERVRYFGGRVTAADDQQIPVGFMEANRIARSMRTLRRSGELATRNDLGVVAFAIGDTNESAERYVASHIGPIRGTSSRDEQLRHTALLYLDFHGSVARVAADLRIHENTVRQRIERLDELLPGWRTGAGGLDVHVALRAHALLDAGRHRI